MRANSVVMLIAAVLFGLGAVLAARSYLQGQLADFTANATTTPSIASIVVAKKPMKFGDIIEAGSLEEITWANDTIPQGAFRRKADVFPNNEKRFALGLIAPGEAILQSKITKPGERATMSTTLSEGKSAVTIRVNDVLGVAGFVLPGDSVDVMLTRGDRSGNGSYVDVLLQSVKVLAIDQLYDEQTNKPSVVKSVTFEVDTREAQKLALGSQIGTLSLALRNLGAENVADETVDRVTVSDLETARSQAPNVRRTISVGVSRGLDRSVYEMRRSAQ